MTVVQTINQVAPGHKTLVNERGLLNMRALVSVKVLVNMEALLNARALVSMNVQVIVRALVNVSHFPSPVCSCLNTINWCYSFALGTL